MAPSAGCVHRRACGWTGNPSSVAGWHRGRATPRTRRGMPRQHWPPSCGEQGRSGAQVLVARCSYWQGPALPSRAKEGETRRSMRILLQRVSRAEVRIRAESAEETPRVAGKIAAGFLVLVGITHTDTVAEARWMADKIPSLRLF